MYNDDDEDLGATLVFRGQHLADITGASKNKYRFMRQAVVSYPTVLRYINSPDSLQMISPRVMYALLTGMGFSDAEILALPFGEVFEIVKPQE